MKRIFLIAAVLCFGLSALANELEIDVNPTQPILIPMATGTSIKAPYFNINNIKLNWSGIQTSFELLAVTVTSEKLPNFSCGGAGAELTNNLFFRSNVLTCNGAVVQPALSSSGNVDIPSSLQSSCPNSVESLSFYCGQVPVAVLPNPTTSYNIPLTVTVYGQAMDAHGVIVHRVMATKEIVVQ